LHGYGQALPHNFLPFVKDRANLVEINSTNEITVSYVVAHSSESLAVRSITNSGWQSIFYLTRLPLEVRNVLAHLLLLPLAVLLTTLFRTLTGVRSYGTFMPALFALALVYAEWQMAAITMCVVLLFGTLSPTGQVEPATSTDSGTHSGDSRCQRLYFTDGLFAVAARWQGTTVARGHYGYFGGSLLQGAREGRSSKRCYEAGVDAGAGRTLPACNAIRITRSLAGGTP
jgi:hypothetical protein